MAAPPCYPGTFCSAVCRLASHFQPRPRLSPKCQSLHAAGYRLRSQNPISTVLGQVRFCRLFDHTTSFWNWPLSRAHDGRLSISFLIHSIIFVSVLRALPYTNVLDFASPAKLSYADCPLAGAKAKETSSACRTEPYIFHSASPDNSRPIGRRHEGVSSRFLHAPSPRRIFSTPTRQASAILQRLTYR